MSTKKNNSNFKTRTITTLNTSLVFVFQTAKFYSGTRNKQNWIVRRQKVNTANQRRQAKCGRSNEWVGQRSPSRRCEMDVDRPHCDEDELMIYNQFQFSKLALISNTFC